ncbi:MAG: sigma-54-dependent Fis family transcriptional regulator [Deferribacteres bacterium]|nr:sigma-54-dependent Fis family transcriptional regulator [Deferribacteres bacterium]
MNIMDTELLEHKDTSRDENHAFSTERLHSLDSEGTGIVHPDLRSLHATEAELRSRCYFESILGHHHGIIEVLKFISRAADTDAAVLIRGESGTGKELVARALHTNSRRRERPFVPVNCGALPESLLETEMFGHVRGAFTGAVRDRAGWFERADAGTIFLDEVSEMPPALQVKLLRVLQSGEYSRVGSTEIRRCDVRILTATNADMQHLVKEGKFRGDLYYRINILDIEIPPLRERRSDIPLLVRHYLKIYGTRHGRDILRMGRDAEALLLSYDFPGNVRELENIIQRAVILSRTALLSSPGISHRSYIRRRQCAGKESSLPSRRQSGRRLSSSSAGILLTA